MKIIKPLRLGILHRPWQWQGENRLGIAVLALTDMSAVPKIRPEPELWQLAAQELTGNAAMVDMALPKPCAEFLATGYAYTHHQAQKNVCLATIRVAEKEKSLLAFGERYWVNGYPSPARPFEKLRLDWENAYGGEHVAENPLGMGAAPVMHEGHHYHPLPRIEHPGHPLGPLRHKTPPCGFGPLDFTWPRQFGRIGKKYDSQWLKQDFPGYARDIDWHLFNRAEPDQWWPQQSALPLEAEWRIGNMHPDKAVQQGRLPPWQARCFIQRAGTPGQSPEEITLRATTLWFFPHLQKMLLIWHGCCAIDQDDAADVRQLTAAMELSREARPPEHYHEVIHRREKKDTGAAHALRDQDLMAESLIAPWLDTDMRQQESPWRENLARREQQRRGQVQVSTADSPDLGTFSTPPPPPALDNLPAFMADMQQQATGYQQQARQKAAAMAAHADINDEPATGPAHYYRLLQLSQSAAASAEPPLTGISHEAGPRQGLHQMYRLSADTRPPAPPLADEHSLNLRRQVQAVMETTRDFRHQDFSGADLRSMDLRRGDFRQALLESAKLDGCLLDDADLGEAMLAHASLCNVSLNNARLDDACLTGAVCQQSRFTAASLQRVLVQQTTFSHCDFQQAKIDGILFHHTRLNDCRFHQAVMENCVFLAVHLERMDFSHGRLAKMTFLDGSLERVNFDTATLTDCSFIHMALDNVRCRKSRLTDCVFTGETRARRADFSHGRLSGCNFRQIALAGADFSRARAEGCDFSAANLTGGQLIAMDARGCLFVRTDFTDARLNQANLTGALLQKCRLAGADLRAANLFRADLSLSVADERTRWQQAYTLQCKTLPRKKGKS
ncbi:DUF2169 domain-containing protein [Sodalis ligni]|uniref:DUF2169 family type VI secretion system accessory protein n=1 Tax=Sodalis ligni TaxID=2697027 RepID=UPI00193FF770|nr:DUF2169 domain-containing protein [Sodalis ligni]QWA11552.1 DUF2169 domain-containing protein [Sodalis ligni]